MYTCRYKDIGTVTDTAEMQYKIYPTSLKSWGRKRKT
jgi:hypothetical protein